jgi:hypothetical protein
MTLLVDWLGQLWQGSLRLRGYLRLASSHDWTCMPNNKAAPARNSRTSPLSGSAEIDAMVARTAPAIIELLGNGTPRPKSAIIAALADRHPKEDIVRTLMRLAVTGQLVERQRKYSLGPASETETEAG